eukprot:TRINITY_DN9357_c0_g1_i1.p1 TRINITY_DN9357_c0_g1~~TRINITY_DN9357_c0_g1_i1.p1  ORF type:complete len:362 (-),score=56.93 TRINITY_DN9357_c0_g1_i1:275-1360(-)
MEGKLWELRLLQQDALLSLSRIDSFRNQRSVVSTEDVFLPPGTPFDIDFAIRIQQMILSECVNLEKSLAPFRLQELPLELVDRIAQFLDKPRDLAAFGATCHQYYELALGQELWSGLYAVRFPVFHAAIFREICLNDSVDEPDILPGDCSPRWEPPRRLIDTRKSWRTLYQETLSGTLVIVLHIYNRDLQIGFLRSYFDALVSYTGGQYFVQYFPHLVHAHEPRVEYIAEDLLARRTRIVPLDLRTHCPYTVYRPPATQQLKIGDVVELQWRKQADGAFGWWYGKVNGFDDEDGVPVVRILFDQFPTASAWFLLRVPPNLTIPWPISASGFVGGIRKLLPAEHAEMIAHISNEPNLFRASV